MRAWPALDIHSSAARPDEDAEWELLQAALTDFDVAAIDENTPGTWRVFFQGTAARDGAATSLALRFPSFTFVAIEVPDEDWAARSQADLKAVRVGNIIVAPPWDIGTRNWELGTRNSDIGARNLDEVGTGKGLHSSAFRVPSSEFTIVIQPSMGFGTGHHATTRLCLDHLQHLDLRSRSVIDVGTGSGVLGIAASRLGATHVLAIDDDPDAIRSARENLDLNPAAEVTLGIVDLRSTRLRPFDLVLANLTGALLTSAAAPLQALAAPGGRLVLSGFMQSDANEVLDAFSSCTIERRTGEQEWVCVTLLRSR